MKKSNEDDDLRGAQLLPRSQNVSNAFSTRSQNVPTAFSMHSPSCSQNVPNLFPWHLHYDQKNALHALLKMHYVSTRALVVFKGGDICLVLVYKATSALLLESPVSSSTYCLFQIART
jgi:hypothetical protein